MVCECVCARGFSPPKHTPQGVKAGPRQGKHCSFPWGSPGDSGRGTPEGPRTLQGPEPQREPGSGQAVSGLWGWRAGWTESQRGEGRWDSDHWEGLGGPGTRKRGASHSHNDYTWGVLSAQLVRGILGGYPLPLQSCLTPRKSHLEFTRRHEASIGQQSPFMMEKLRHSGRTFPRPQN